jgi:hypothetical protein
MYKLSGITLFLVFIFQNAFSQEELLKETSGITLGYISGVNMPTERPRGFGLSSYFAKDFTLGVSAEKANNTLGANAFLSYSFNNTIDNKTPSFAMGISYSYFLNGSVKAKSIGIHPGIFKVFFADSNNPFVIYGNSSFQFIKSEDGNTSPFNATVDLIPTVGLAYVQSFFAKSRVYPWVGISRIMNLIDDDRFTFITFGLNIKLNSKESKKS